MFRAMFTSKMEEAATSEVTISDFSEESVEKMVAFMYSGEQPDTSYDEEVLKIADKYGVELLKARCEASLAKTIDDSNVAGMWVLADTFQANALKAEVFRYLSDNWQRRSRMADLEQVLVDNPGLIKDLLPIITLK